MRKQVESFTMAFSSTIGVSFKDQEELCEIWISLNRFRATIYTLEGFKKCKKKKKKKSLKGVDPPLRSSIQQNQVKNINFQMPNVKNMYAY